MMVKANEETDWNRARAVGDTLMPSAATRDPIRQRLPGTLRRVSVTSAGGERDKGRETHRESDRERERESPDQAHLTHFETTGVENTLRREHESVYVNSLGRTTRVSLSINKATSVVSQITQRTNIHKYLIVFSSWAQTEFKGSSKTTGGSITAN